MMDVQPPSWFSSLGTASIRDNMLYSGSKEAIKSALNGVGIHINCTDRAELDYESSVLPAVKKFT
jgi:cofilin